MSNLMSESMIIFDVVIVHERRGVAGGLSSR